MSGSADERAGSQSGLSSLWERVRGVSVENGRTVEMPALGLMADAFLADADLRGVTIMNIADEVLSGREKGERPPLDRALELMEGNFRRRATEAHRRRCSVRGRLAPRFQAHDLRRAHPAGASSPARAGRSRRWTTAPRPSSTRRSSASIARPPITTRSCTSAYMEMLAISAIYTNDVFALLDEQLGGAKLADPDDARARVLTTFQAIPFAQLKAMLDGATRKVVGGHFNTDLTGSGNVHFTHAPAGDFVGDARGLTWTKAGGVWFGDGHINGQTVNLRLASTTSLSQRQAQSGTASTTAGADVSGSGSAGPR